MGSENEKRQMAIELNGEFIGLGENFTPPLITLAEQDGTIEPHGSMDMEFSFALHPTKKFMRRVRWAILKDDLASFLSLFLPRRRGKDG